MNARSRLVTIVTAGSRGDVQPYLALGVGLASAGLRVRLATHENFRATVEAHGLEFAPVTGDPQAVLRAPGADRWLASGRRRGALGFAREMRRLAGPLFTNSLDDFWHAADGADALLYSLVCTPVWQVAERLGIPSWGAYLQPATRTGAFPAVGFPPAPHLGATFNRATHRAVEQLAWRPFRRALDAWRDRTLSAPPMPSGGPFALMGRQQAPVLYGFSRAVVPPPADWPPAVRVTGYWFLDEPAGWQPPDALARFLADGPPPVYIGFGSMTPQNATRLTRIALDALALAGVRGLLGSGWGTLGSGELPSWAHAVGDVPHAWLFPRTAAVVHHGGAGTTGAGFRAGVPSIIVPLGFDQGFWGARAHALGVGPRPIPRRQLTAERLAAAIRHALKDDTRHRAAMLGLRIRGEDGVGDAVAAVTAGLAAHYRVADAG